MKSSRWPKLIVSFKSEISLKPIKRQSPINKNKTSLKPNFENKNHHFDTHVRDLFDRKD